MAPALASAGALVLWHCHIGTTACARAAAPFWSAFRAELDAVGLVVTAERSFTPAELPADRIRLVPPAVDPTAAKNRPLRAASVTAILDWAGGPGGPAVVEEQMPLPADAPMVLQVSRWDPLKDMAGLVRCVPDLPDDTHLVLCGTDPAEIPDGPEGYAVLDEVRGSVVAIGRAMQDTGTTSPMAGVIADLDEWEPVWPTNTRVACAEHFAARRAAMPAHRSQMTPDAYDVACPVAIERRAWSTEDYHLARSRVSVTFPENDLSVGVPAP